VRLAAIGPATAEKIRSYSLRVDLEPTRFVAEGLIEALEGTGSLKGLRILLPRADIARKALAKGLRDRGASVTEVTAYRTVADPGDITAARDALTKGEVDWVTFTSASTAKNFVAKMGGETLKQLKDLGRMPRFVSIGPQTSAALAGLGLEVAAEATVYTIDGVVEAILESQVTWAKKGEAVEPQRLSRPAEPQRLSRPPEPPDVFGPAEPAK
jgi:uroporphyrinogen III methyltransferase/synthase